MEYAWIEWLAMDNVSEEQMGWMMIYRGSGRHELDGQVIYQHGLNGQPWMPVMYQRSGLNEQWDVIYQG